MTAVFVQTVLSILGSTALLFGLYFLWRAFTSRRRSAKAVYNVEQLTARQSSELLFGLGIALLFFGLLFWGVALLDWDDSEVLEELVKPTVEQVEIDVETAVPDPTATLTIILTQPASSLPTRTPEPTATLLIVPTEVPAVTDTLAPTSTPEIPTAVVDSGVGVWLRETASTEAEQLEWVLGGTVLTLLSGTESTEIYDWQQVRTPTGNEGWVATDFIVYNNP